MVRRWDVTRRVVTRPPLATHTDAVDALAFRNDGGALVTAAGGVVRVWDAAQGTPIGSPLTISDRPLESVAFTRGGDVLATSDGTGEIRLWDLARRAQLGESLGGESLTAAPGAAVATVDSTGAVMFWDELLASTDYEAWRKRLCGIARRNLTQAEWRDLIPDRPYPSRAELACQ
jgi:WD40 repeat protein